jgi:hypothetical protein
MIYVYVLVSAPFVLVIASLMFMMWSLRGAPDLVGAKPGFEGFFEEEE